MYNLSEIPVSLFVCGSTLSGILFQDQICCVSPYSTTLITQGFHNYGLGMSSVSGLFLSLLLLFANLLQLVLTVQCSEI